MKKTLIAVFAGIFACAAVALVTLLTMSLFSAFSHMPTDYENTVWLSEDGAFTLTVGEYDKNELMCRSEITYNGAAYEVYSEQNGALTVSGDGGSDTWLRKSCNKDGCVLVINRSGALGYSGDYPASAEVRFSRK